MPTRCEWCGQVHEVEEWEQAPREIEDEEERYAGLCVVCQLQLDTTGTLQTYHGPTEDLQRRWPDPRAGL